MQAYSMFYKVLLAFMVGLHNLYWYYGSQTYHVYKDGVKKQVHTSEAFQGYFTTCTLHLCSFK